MTRTIRFARTVILAAVLMLTAASAQAAVINIFNSEAAWLAAVGVVTLEDFEDAALAAGLTSITGASASISGGVLNDQANDGVGVTSTTFAFNPGILAFGGFFNMDPGGFGSGLQVDVDFVGGGSQTVGEFLATAFWGFTSDEEISAVRLSMGNFGGIETYNLDNLQFSSEATVPEPVTLLLFSAGVGAVAARRRLKGRA